MAPMRFLQGYVVLCLLLPLSSEESKGNIEHQLERMGAHTALIAPSSAVDGCPLWSPDSAHIGVNIAGKWYYIDTEKVLLKQGQWHGQTIGVLSSSDGVSPAEVQDVEVWRKSTKTDTTTLIDGAGTKIEFVRKNLATSLVLRPKAGKKIVLWKSNLENCGELSLSPSGRWLAYVCEQNGVFVTDLYRVVKGH